MVRVTDRGRSGPQRTDTEIRSVTDRGRSGPQRTDTEIRSELLTEAALVLRELIQRYGQSY